MSEICVDNRRGSAIGYMLAAQIIIIIYHFSCKYKFEVNLIKTFILIMQMILNLNLPMGMVSRFSLTVMSSVEHK